MSESTQSHPLNQASALVSAPQGIAVPSAHHLPENSARRPVAPPATPGTRVVAGIIAAGSLAVLIVAASLQALPQQLGTHTQLGFPSCQWITNLGVPCPTCGMTTAFTNVVHGNLLEGFLSQPFGFILAIGTGMAFWISTLVLVTGSHVYRCVTALWKPSFIWSLAILAFLSWAYKMWRMTSPGEFG